MFGGVDFFLYECFKILVPNTMPMAVSKYLVTVLNEPINWFLDYGCHLMYFLKSHFIYLFNKYLLNTGHYSVPKDVTVHKIDRHPI